MKQKVSYTVCLEFIMDTALDEGDIEKVAYNILDALWNWVDDPLQSIAPSSALTSGITVDFDIHTTVRRYGR